MGFPETLTFGLTSSCFLSFQRRTILERILLFLTQCQSPWFSSCRGWAERVLILPCLQASGCQKSAGCRQAQSIWSQSCQGLAQLSSTHLSKFLRSVGLASERYSYTDTNIKGRSKHSHTTTPKTLTHWWLQVLQQIAVLSLSANVVTGWSLCTSIISLEETAHSLCWVCEASGVAVQLTHPEYTALLLQNKTSSWSKHQAY